jgi:hypothetical protein
MCEVSDKLKLCTCSSDISKLKYYWVFYRYVGDKLESIMGEPIMPVAINPETDLLNQQLLAKLLNDGNVFDFELNPRAKDRLLLAFNIAKGKKDESWLHYGFEYKRKKWTGCEYDSFDWENQLEEEKFGKILGALKKHTV